MASSPPQTDTPAATAGARSAGGSRREHWRAKLAVGSLLLLGLTLIAAWVWPLPPAGTPEPGALGAWIQVQEKNAFRRTPWKTSELKSVTFADAQRGWAVSSGGLMLASFDGGKNWTAQSLPTNGNERLNSVVFIDSKRGWAVGDNGTILATIDSGKNWSAQLAPNKNHLFSVTFVDSQRGWAVGHSGTILATEDSGEKWTIQQSPTTDSLFSVTFADSQNGWAVGMDGLILATNDGGKAWNLQKSSTTAGLHSVTFVDRQTGWIVGENALILNTKDGGKIWTVQSNISGDVLLQTTNDLYAVCFVDAKHGCAVGNNGTILTSSDGGSAWFIEIAPTEQMLLSVSFIDSQRGWAVGDDGTILTTSDGGRKWQTQDPFPYEVYPPKLLWAASSLSVLGLIASVAWPRRKFIAGGVSIEEALISDRPIERASQAPRWMVRLVDGLANYLGNPSTAAPVTLAVTGRWGQGKSSVMGLLKAELARRGHRPVWFNAWHHQEAENVLAALLGAIREQAIPPLLAFPPHPPFLAFDGIVYRARLALRRGQRLWLRVLFLNGLVAFSVAFVSLNWEFLDSVKFGDLSASGSISQWIQSLLALGVGPPALFKLLNLLRAFVVNPARLLLQPGNGSNAGELEVVNVYRTRFAVEFGEVTAALGKNHRMVIFIDDLDRCAPAHLLQVLEATNFLNSSGECFIVFGMQRESVLAGLKAELADAQLGPDKDPERWLEKLIQIEVGVPGDDQALNELLRENSAPDPAAKRAQRWERIRLGFLGTLGLGMFAGLIWGGIYFGAKLDLPPAPKAEAPKPYTLEVELPAWALAPNDAARAAAAANPLPAEKQLSLKGTYDEKERKLSLKLADPPPPALTTTVVTPPAASPNSRELKDDKTPNSGPGDITPDVTEPTNRGEIAWWLGGLGFVGAALAIAALNRRYRESPIDSVDFRDAIRAWGEHITKACETPRELKRLLNRMRFDAMLVRSLQPDPSESGDVGADPVAKREGEIVTLAILDKMRLLVDHHFDANRQEGRKASAGPTDDKLRRLAELTETPDLSERIDRAFHAYTTDPAFAAFRKYKESIRV